MKQIIIDQNMNPSLLEYNTELWHAPVGAFLVRNEVGITDKEVLDAIAYHTSGRPGMTLLEKLCTLLIILNLEGDFQVLMKCGS